MSGCGNNQHNKILRETIEELRSKGYNAIETQNISPDGIVVINNKIIAIEVISGGNKAIQEKKDRYSMFDDIIFRTFNREPLILTEIEKEQKEMEYKAKCIVNTFIRNLQKNNIIEGGEK